MDEELSEGAAMAIGGGTSNELQAHAMSHPGVFAEITRYGLNRIGEIVQQMADSEAHAANPSTSGGRKHVSIPNVSAIIAERDALRAEVERLTRERDVAVVEREMADHTKAAWRKMCEESQDMTKQCLAEIERLRKGREDESILPNRGGIHNDAACVDSVPVAGRIRAATDVRMAVAICRTADTLDPRLGLPQPEGEPVEPMSAKGWRWLG